MVSHLSSGPHCPNCEDHYEPADDEWTAMGYCSQSCAEFERDTPSSYWGPVAAFFHGKHVLKRIHAGNREPIEGYVGRHRVDRAGPGVLFVVPVELDGKAWILSPF